MYTNELRPEVCTFCAELLGLLEKSNYGKLTNQVGAGRILWRDDEFALIPSLGPLLEVHLLLIPASHVFSFATLSETTLFSAAELIASIGRFFKKSQEPTLVFEHGAITLDDSEYEKRLKRAQSGACTDHAHVHILQGISAQQVVSSVDKMQIHKKKSHFKSLRELPEKVKKDMAYITIGDADTQLWDFYLLEKVPRQFMRRVIASIIGLEEWDWYEFPNIELVQKAVKLLGPSLNKWLSTEYK
jgi:hypothetical protein